MKKLNLRQILSLLESSVAVDRPSLEYAFDLNNIPEEDLQKAYVDFRWEIPQLNVPKAVLMETNYFDIIPKETVDIHTTSEKIKKAFELSPWQILNVIPKVSENKVGVVVCIANINYNFVDLVKFLKRLGYFNSTSYIKKDQKGREWIFIQFEPYFENDSSDEIRKFPFVYHLTYKKNIASIKEEGLVPKNENKFFKYPPRIYFFKGDVTTQEIEELSVDLKFISKEKEMVLCTCSLTKIPDDIPFYYDLNMEKGFFCEKPIPKESIIHFEEI